MIKEIKYGGYTTSPSDRESPDGDLATAINLIPEDGALKPILPPSTLLHLNTDESILLIHSVPGQKNYILARETGNETSLLWLKQKPDLIDTKEAIPIGSFTGVKDIAPIGNTLVIATEDELVYLYWKDSAYGILGSRPPFITIDFGLRRVGTLKDSDTFEIPARCAAGWSAQRGKAEQSELASVTQMVYALLNPALADNVVSKGRFYQPFFIRYAYRLYDGSYSWHSAPILMLPTITPPIVRYADDGSHPGAEGTIKSTFTLDVNYFELTYRILSDCADELEAWSDLVVGIDIFITAPIYTYDQSKNLEWRPVSNSRSMLLDLLGTGSFGNRPGISGSTPSTNTPSEVFVGHYADSVDSPYIDHSMSTTGDASFQIWNIKPHEKFHDNIRNAANFYKISEIDIGELKAMSQMTPLKLTATDLSSLVTFPLLTDDYQSHCRISCSSLYPFNSRLNLAGVSIAPAMPFPLRSVSQYGNPEGASLSVDSITVWTRLNGVKAYSVRNGGNLEEDSFMSPASNFPRYIFYPDASAFKMKIEFSDGTSYIIPLISHDFLNGAYYYNDVCTLNPAPADEESEPTDAIPMVPVKSKIYTSEVNNPFYFPVLGINTVGQGSVLALSSAAKALSQGQFGQFPLYAFTTEGVWALETSASGTYIARQPITRDVCINPDGITQIDSAVLFPTDRGIMLISGSQTQCISDVITNEVPFDARILPGMKELHAMIGHDDDTCFPVIHFLDFVASCGMVYDYLHQRIIVFNKNYTYAYVYSLKSKNWGMTFSKIADTINSYPEALAVDRDGNLISFSRPSTDDSQLKTDDPQLLITRPIKLGEADILKTIDTLYQRGVFRSGHVKSVLYGSRDLFNWHLVNSSVSHRIVNHRGTPYKYFRIALVCELDTDETLCGCTVQYTPRFTNRLR